MSALRHRPICFAIDSTEQGNAMKAACHTIRQGLSTLAGLVLALGSATSQAETYYFHNDHLGTPQVVTDDSGTVVWQGVQKPFGEVVETTAQVEQNIRFPGQYLERESGLHYNYFRDYEPTAGRYAEGDPIGLWGGMSLYSYVTSNPITLIDSKGLAASIGGECFFQKANPDRPDLHPTSETRRDATKQWSRLFCFPKPIVGRPDLGSGAPKPTDFIPIEFTLLCQRTSYEEGNILRKYNTSYWGVLRCFDRCGKFTDEVLGYKDGEPVWKIEGAYDDSHVGDIFEMSSEGTGIGPGDLPPLRK